MWLRDLLAPRSRNIPVEKSVILIIADISGYTEFMMSTQTALLHGQTIINELIQSIIEEVRIPLKVAKLEGDAVFLYAAYDDSSLDKTSRQIGQKLIAFFGVFSRTLQALATHTHCTCDACANINRLRLKVVVHTGSALFSHIGDFLELGGMDVIIAHRLLKNSVTLQEYILMTEPAFQHIPIPIAVEAYEHEETYPTIGCLRLRIYPLQD
jgi:class 3 adenylate cyclase